MDDHDESPLTLSGIDPQAILDAQFPDFISDEPPLLRGHWKQEIMLPVGALCRELDLGFYAYNGHPDSRLLGIRKDLGKKAGHPRKCKPLQPPRQHLDSSANLIVEAPRSSKLRFAVFHKIPASAAYQRLAPRKVYPYGRGSTSVWNLSGSECAVLAWWDESLYPDDVYFQMLPFNEEYQLNVRLAQAEQFFERGQ